GLSRAAHGRRSARTGDVFDDDTLSELLVQSIRDDPRDDVGPAARRKRHDDGDGPGWIVVRASRRGAQGQKRSQTCEQFHGFQHLSSLLIVRSTLRFPISAVFSSGTLRIPGTALWLQQNLSKAFPRLDEAMRLR